MSIEYYFEIDFFLKLNPKDLKCQTTDFQHNGADIKEIIAEETEKGMANYHAYIMYRCLHFIWEPQDPI